MTDLQTILTAIDHLDWRELGQVERAIELRRRRLEVEPPTENLSPEEWGAKLHEAIAAMWEDTTPEEMAEIIAAMNEKYIEPFEKIDKDFAWIDELPEDER